MSVETMQARHETGKKSSTEPDSVKNLEIFDSGYPVNERYVNLLDSEVVARRHHLPELFFRSATASHFVADRFVTLPPWIWRIGNYTMLIRWRNLHVSVVNGKFSRYSYEPEELLQPIKRNYVDHFRRRQALTKIFHASFGMQMVLQSLCT
jgi:hypothetical protein